MTGEALPLVLGGAAKARTCVVPDIRVIEAVVGDVSGIVGGQAEGGGGVG